MSIKKEEMTQLKGNWEEGWNFLRETNKSYYYQKGGYVKAIPKSIIRSYFISREQVEKVIEKMPMDFCNDGKYTDKEMIDCLSGVIKANYDYLCKELLGKEEEK